MLFKFIMIIYHAFLNDCLNQILPVDFFWLIFLIVVSLFICPSLFNY